MKPYDKLVLEAISDANYVVVTKYHPSWKNNGCVSYASWCSTKISERMMLGEAKKLSEQQKDEKDCKHWVAHYKKSWKNIYEPV